MNNASNSSWSSKLENGSKPLDALGTKHEANDPKSNAARSNKTIHCWPPGVTSKAFGSGSIDQSNGASQMAGKNDST